MARSQLYTLSIRASAALSRSVIEDVAVTRPLFIWKKSCSTCRRARAFLAPQLAAGAVQEREINASPLTQAELDLLVGPRDHTLFLNTRNELYRAKKMKQAPPSRAEALALIAAEPNLLKRPLLVRGDRIVFGFDEEGFSALAKED